MATINRERNIPLGTFTNQRKDNWWFMPALQGLVIIVFVIYTTVMLFFYKDYRTFNNFRSPIFDAVPVGFQKFIGWPVDNFWFPAAILVLWVPIGYRGTCYYMRRIYYRSFFGNPPACATNGVTFRRGKYSGETRLPFILNNYHRYFLYLAIIVALFHWYELLMNGFRLVLPNGNTVYGVSLATVLLALDTILLSFYILSCHAFRHLLGGGSDCHTCSGVKSLEYHGWRIFSKLNEMHGTWFWLSLISVMVADFYIRLLAGNFGVHIQDFVFFHL